MMLIWARNQRQCLVYYKKNSTFIVVVMLMMRKNRKAAWTEVLEIKDYKGYLSLILCHME